MCKKLSNSAKSCLKILQHMNMESRSVRIIKMGVKRLLTADSVPLREELMRTRLLGNQTLAGGLELYRCTLYSNSILHY